MRVLFTLNPVNTVFKYMAPLGWALRTAGHEVRFASLPSFADKITQAGLTAVPVGRDRSPRLGRPKEDVEAERAGIPAPYDAFTDPDKATWEYLRPAMAEAAMAHKYADFPVIGGLVDFARHWKPDLVIWESMFVAGSLAAKACGAAHARLLFGIDIFGGVRQLYRRLRNEQPPGEQADPMADWLGSYARRHGAEFSDDMLTGHFTIDHLPRSLQVEADGLDYLRTQFIPYGGPAVVPPWLRKPPRRPRVALTMGLSATEVFTGYNVPVAEILDALSDLDIEVVATVAAGERHKLGTTPDNARIVSYVPMHALVPTCTAIIHHAGAATLATAARHPIPHLSLHYHFDQPILARLLTRHGAGLDIHTSEVTGDNVRESLLRLLNESRFARRAADLRDEMLALPTPNQLVHQLEELTTKHRTS